MFNSKLVRFLSAAAVVVAIPVAIAARPASKLTSHAQPMHTQTPKAVSTSHGVAHSAPKQKVVVHKTAAKKHIAKRSVRSSRHVRTHVRSSVHGKRVATSSKHRSTAHRTSTHRPTAHRHMAVKSKHAAARH